VSNKQQEEKVVSTKNQEPTNKGGSIVDVLGKDPLHVLKEEQDRIRQEILAKKDELKEQARQLREEQRELSHKLRAQEKEANHVYAVQLANVRTVTQGPAYGVVCFNQSDKEREQKDLTGIYGEVRATSSGFTLRIMDNGTIIAEQVIEGKGQAGAYKPYKALKALMVKTAANL